MRAAYDQQGLEHDPAWYPPDLLPGADQVVVAYGRLGADRPVTLGGMGGIIYGRIPYMAIARYAELRGLSVDEFERFDRLITAIDADELPIINAKANKRP